MQNHFVSYWSLGGFNNRLQALQIALLLSKLLNRTLIVGPFTLGHDKGRETPYTEFLDPIEWPTVNWNSPELQGKLELSKSNTANVNFAWRRNCSVPLPHVVSELESLASVQVLHYPYYSGFWRILFSSEYHEVIGHFFDRSLRLKQALYDEAISISGVLQKPYAVIHFRLGDRYGLPLVNCSEFLATPFQSFDFGGFPNWFDPKMPAATWEAVRFGCVKRTTAGSQVNYVTTEMAAAAWDLASINPKIRDVYIATNRPNKSRVQKLKILLQDRNLTPWTWEKLLSERKNQSSKFYSGDRDGSIIGVMEQVLAIEAEAFLPAWSSSWDSVVITRRQARGKPQAGSHHELALQSLLRFATRFDGLKCQDKHHKNTTTRTPPQEHHHKNTTTRTPPQEHHHKNTTTRTPPQEHHHKNTTTRTPPQEHHHKNTTTRTPPQEHHHKNTTTRTPPQEHHHKNTTTKTPPQEHHHKNTTTRTPPQKHHHKNTTTKTPPQEHHHKNTTTKTPPQEHHHKNTTTRTPPQEHHHKNTTTRTPPQEHHHKNTTTRTPPQEHHHKNTTTRTPPQEHHHKNTTTRTPPQEHHHKNTTTRTPPEKHHHKNTTTKTPPQEHHHTNTTTKTQPHKHHHKNTSTKNTTTRTPPQKHHHKNTTTKTPPQKHHHKNTTTKTPPQKHHHTNTTTRTPPHEHHHKNTTTKTPPQKHHHTTPPHEHHHTNTTTKTLPRVVNQTGIEVFPDQTPFA